MTVLKNIKDITNAQEFSFACNRPRLSPESILSPITEQIVLTGVTPASILKDIDNSGVTVDMANTTVDNITKAVRESFRVAKEVIKPAAKDVMAKIMEKESKYHLNFDKGVPGEGYIKFCEADKIFNNESVISLLEELSTSSIPVKVELKTITKLTKSLDSRVFIDSLETGVGYIDTPVREFVMGSGEKVLNHYINKVDINAIYDVVSSAVFEPSHVNQEFFFGNSIYISCALYFSNIVNDLNDTFDLDEFTTDELNQLRTAASNAAKKALKQIATINEIYEKDTIALKDFYFVNVKSDEHLVIRSKYQKWFELNKDSGVDLGLFYYSIISKDTRTFVSGKVNPIEVVSLRKQWENYKVTKSIELDKQRTSMCRNVIANCLFEKLNELKDNGDIDEADVSTRMRKVNELLIDIPYIKQDQIYSVVKRTLSFVYTNSNESFYILNSIDRHLENCGEICEEKYKQAVAGAAIDLLSEWAVKQIAK